MASKEHQDLSSYIKSVHKHLREQSNLLGPQLAWDQHTQDHFNLKKYSEAMKTLALNHWEHNFKSKPIVSRNQWTYESCKNYFETIQKPREKELEIAAKLSLNPNDFWTSKEKLKLLDVGSCYNPFKEYGLFDPVAIDIAPATEDVKKCDFLNVQESDNLKKGSFDVVVFSLLLEYLPSAEQRLSCCVKAYELLCTEGVLVIITPDSKHVGANSKIIKSWRYVLADVGFSRVKYEKLQHLHCMLFRKALDKRITKRWIELHSNYDYYKQLVIPQDLNQSKP